MHNILCDWKKRNFKFSTSNVQCSMFMLLFFFNPIQRNGRHIWVLKGFNANFSEIGNGNLPNVCFMTPLQALYTNMNIYNDSQFLQYNLLPCNMICCPWRKCVATHYNLLPRRAEDTTILEPRGLRSSLQVQIIAMEKRNKNDYLLIGWAGASGDDHLYF